MKGWMIVTILAVAGVFAFGVSVPATQADEPAAPATQAAQAEQVRVYQCPMHPDTKATWAANCPKCGMKMVEAKKPAGMQMPMMGMGAKAEAGAQMPMMGMMSDMQGMMMRCKMMMGAKMAKTDPASVLALKDELKLTDVQVRALEQIAATTRKQTEAILTDEQTKKLAAMAGKPQSMMEMHKRMQQMMMGQMKEGAAATEGQ